MASVCDDPNGRRRILFVNPEGNRKAIHLGKIDRKTADSVCRHVETLLASKITGQPLERSTAAWLSGIGDTLKEKLANVGLVEAQLEAIHMSDLLKLYLSRGDVKDSTKTIRTAWANSITGVLGNRRIDTVSAVDAERLRDELIKRGLAGPTVGRVLRFARQLFSVAVKRGWLTSNPFDTLAHNFREGSGRPRDYAEVSDVARLIEASPPAWKVLIALARYAGLRCPSEALILKWEDVNLPNRRLTVTSPKTENQGKGWRAVPISPALFPILEEAWELSEGQEYVVNLPQYRDKVGNWINCNTRTQLVRLMKRAGTPCWPKAFRLLRSSCVTDWAKDHPIHAVAAFAGHTIAVSGKHYLTVIDRDFLKATGQDGTEEMTAQKTAQQSIARQRTEQQRKESQNPEVLEIAIACDELPENAAQTSYPSRVRTPSAGHCFKTCNTAIHPRCHW